MLKTGLITKHTGSWYTVRDDADSIKYHCTLRGKMRLKDMKTTNPVAVGDKVAFEVVDQTQEQGVITKVMPRRNYMIRRSTNLSRQAHILAANIDRAFLIVTITQPKTSFEFVDRFLVTAEAYKIPVSLVINKIDLYTAPDVCEDWYLFKDIYGSIGYEILEVSVLNQQGLEGIKQYIPGHICLFSGNSGVGKSSLINTITGLNLKTAIISDAHQTGTHTTTFYEMFETLGGFIIDTPGIKGFGLFDMEEVSLGHFFPEIFRHSNCRFDSCTHTHEPGCLVKEAVEEGVISESRYNSYVKMLDGDDRYR